MLIDTRQIIGLTDLRGMLGQFVEEANKGKTFLISDKGKIKAAIGPSFSQAIDRQELARRYKEIQERAVKEAKDKNGWDSTKLIRKMRDDRTRYLLKREGMI